MATNRKDPASKFYYFIDIDLYSRQIVSWDSDTQDNVNFSELSNGCYRVFLPRGQYNKLVKRLEETRA
ncbi:hypothetical protein SAMN06265222_12445 [Neorhodopirellula lusitana]|uniref:Uncharacterized protein n=1 Tax=Neorhodopirellula lusitana TaxID=445327 RepID=A0ABY1QSW6_9BACT|nr:hypothetical protein [Neorhodopirellula lusitana]SMP78074.1 hypothetical protein SAMN06265222_12445 [Neorhodopirellula lusitana]